MINSLLLLISILLIIISYMRIVLIYFKTKNIELRNMTGFDLAKELTSNYDEINIIESKELNISKNTILNQCRGNIRTKPRCEYYFKFQ